MKITATIERNDNNYFQISSDDEILGHCFGGYGYSVDEAKTDFFKSIEEAKEMIAADGQTLPAEASDIEVTFRYDIPSFFSCYEWINISAFAKMAGINQSKMRAYKAGVAFPSAKTLAKIQSTIKTLGAALSEANV